ncbi:MAG: acyl-CoA thioesterase [Planctomycetota bacterium]
MPAYEHRHVVGFEETSLVGNVYFTNYLLWQGHCREMFLRDTCPEVLGLLERREVAFFTKNCSCDWRGEWGFGGFDEVLVRMNLARFRGGRMWLEFTFSPAARPAEIVATGTQEVHCKANRNGSWVPAPFPAPMLKALLAYADTEEIRSALRDGMEFGAAG